MLDNLIGGRIDEEVAILGACRAVAAVHLMGFEVRKLDIVFAGSAVAISLIPDLALTIHGTVRHGSLVHIPGPKTNLQPLCGCEEGKRSRSFTDGQLKSRE